jgi:mRNA-degrading endonuclease toxin of MazEF toxin-antitoxin module
VNQIRSVDEKRLVRTLGQLRPATMAKVNQAPENNPRTLAAPVL